jgi:hypothetical protein
MVKINTFFAEWWSGPTSADRQGQNTGRVTVSIYTSKEVKELAMAKKTIFMNSYNVLRLLWIPSSPIQV